MSDTRISEKALRAFMERAYEKEGFEAEEARQIVARAEPDIDNVIAAVRENRAFPPPRRKFYDRFMSGPVNPIFYSCFVKANAFTTGNACTGCGQCVRRCPTNNITLQTGRPVWGQDCTHCMACICRCPEQAIEYGKASLGKPRYQCPGAGEGNRGPQKNI